MVDLKAKPYCLPDEDVRWVEETIAGMTPEEKVGQLFFQLTASQDENYLRELMEKYHLGGCRYNPMPGAAVQQQNRTLQKYAKVPVFIACNTEAGGDGACADGTNIGSGIKIGATRNNDYAYALGKMANEEAAAIGCNMAFAPVCDIHYNWENTEIVTRAFGNDPVRVAQMSKAYMDGLHTIPGFACTAKHFPATAWISATRICPTMSTPSAWKSGTRPTGWCIKRLLTAVWMPSWAGISCCRSTRGPSIPR